MSGDVGWSGVTWYWSWNGCSGSGVCRDFRQGGGFGGKVCGLAVVDGVGL